MASGDDGSTQLGSNAYYCHQCHQQVVAFPPAPICPVCNGGFLELYSNFAVPDDDDDDGTAEASGLLHTDSVTRQRILDTFNVESISDLLGEMHVYDDFYTDHFLSENVEPQIPPGYSSDDVVMDTAEWDRVLAWYFENEGAFLSDISRLPEEQIETIPVCHMKAKDIEKTSTCSICFDDFKLMEEVKILPCKHLFHKECIVSWLRVRATCPVCRQTLKVDDRPQNHPLDLRVRSTVREAANEDVNEFSESSLRDEHRSTTVTETSCDNLAHSLTGRNTSSSSGAFSQNQRTVNHTHDVRADEHTMHDEHNSSMRSSNTSRREYSATPPPAHIRPPRRRSRNGTDHERNHSARLPPGRRALYRSAFAFADMPYLSDFVQPNMRNTSYNGFPFQPQQSVNNSAGRSRYRRSPHSSSFDDSSNRNQHSNSSSLEDLSSVVPILPANVVL